jgi:hypothetical protein
MDLVEVFQKRLCLQSRKEARGRVVDLVLFFAFALLLMVVGALFFPYRGNYERTVPLLPGEYRPSKAAVKSAATDVLRREFLVLMEKGGEAFFWLVDDNRVVYLTSVAGESFRYSRGFMVSPFYLTGTWGVRGDEVVIARERTWLTTVIIYVCLLIMVGVSLRQAWRQTWRDCYISVGDYTVRRSVIQKER